MLKITSDGRKLGLDQRIVNQMLPDEPGTKVNQCVDNIMQIWRNGKADKLTQLVFCDISTPQAKAPASKAAKTLDNPLLHALEGAVPLPEQEPVFTVYDDIRQKLIAQGMPADQIAFIHEANTEVRKKELFSKVRTGQVRVLLGSTAKMGAGTNVQDRLVALHDLDCPWRPGDLAQRKGRIERQGNQNPLVHVYRYVTEGTFDAYLWQTVENKQKFISQIMTSKSPVRSCDDVDETALSFAEIKALCAGDPRIKERMDLDVEVSRLKLMKADHQSKQYRLEDQLLKYFPEEIEKHKGFIKGFESDLEVLTAHPHPEDGFVGMEIRGDLLTDKENAGAALLDACKEVKTSDSVQIGSYRGFTMLVEFEVWKQEYTLLLKGQMTHRATLGTDPRGNLTRIDNALAQMPQRLEAVKNQLENLYQQQAAAKEAEPPKVNLLVDIQAKLQAGKGAGYARWAKVFNLKQMAQTMNYLSENNLLEYAVLEEKAAAATAHHNELSAHIKAAEKRMAEIAVLRTHIVNYAKTREVYVAYRKAGYSKKFREEHEEEILLHQAAKNAFDEMGVKKLPKVKELQTEYAKLLEEKKKTYSEYRRSREEMRELLTAKANVDRVLKMEVEQDVEKEKDHGQR